MRGEGDGKRLGRGAVRACTGTLPGCRLGGVLYDGVKDERGLAACVIHTVALILY